MKPVNKRLATFNDRYPLIGPVVWMSSVQYFVTQLVVAAYWSQPFSLLHNTISDLGNTVCGRYGDRLVCSPLHSWMNASFIVVGATQVAGASLIYQEFRGKRAGLGFAGMVAAGLGTILVGIFPENTVSALHFTGALLPFVIGNISLIIFGLRLPIPKRFGIFTAALGVIGLVAVLLFEAHIYLGLDIGGMERIGAYPQTIWLIVFGMYMTRRHYANR